MAGRINLDLDTLRTLVVAHERGGLVAAAAGVGRTPSALSLQIKRLQRELGTPLFRKRGRGLALTEAGEVALSYARHILDLNDELLETLQGANLAGQIRIGCAQDFASILPGALSRFAALYPRMQIELHIEGNAALVDAVAHARIDLAVVVGHEGHPNARTVGRVDLVWISSPGFSRPPKEPLSLAALGPQCIFRRRAVEHLEAAGIPHRIVANSPSLNGLWAALLSGLGVTARTAFNLPDGLAAAPSLHQLPVLGSLAVTLHRGAHSRGPAVDRMASLLVGALPPGLQPDARSPSTQRPRKGSATPERRSRVA